MNITYRLADKQDIPFLTDLRIKLDHYTCLRDGLNLENEEQLRENIRNTLSEDLNKSIFFYIALDEGNIIACGGLVILKVLPYHLIPSGIKGYITSVYTEEQYRRLGLQKNIIEGLLELAKEKNCNRVELDALNPHAIKLYETFGFQKKIINFIYKYER